MKRFAIAASALLIGLTPIAASAAPRYDAPQNRPAAERREERRDERRDDRRDARQEARWDARQHNGYSYQGRWHYGAPPAAYYGRADFRPGYKAWTRGERVPAYYRDHAHRVDWRRERLKAPPRGYEYVRDDRGSVLLVGIATGVILTAILAR